MIMLLVGGPTMLADIGHIAFDVGELQMSSKERIRRSLRIVLYTCE
jgi:hypothetical protein